MQRGKVRLGAAWLVGLSCLCILVSTPMALADAGSSRTVTVTLVGATKADMPSGVLIYLDSSGEHVRATPDGAGGWYFEVPCT